MVIMRHDDLDNMSAMESTYSFIKSVVEAREAHKPGL